jgi:SulP family sulfate permease
MAAIGEEDGARRRLPEALMPAVMVGTIAGLDTLGSGLAIASLLFAGPLVSGLGLGVGVVLLGAAVLAFYVALRSTQPNSVALVQETAVAILAGAMAEMALRLEAPAEAKVATGLAILGVSSLVTGGLFWITGRLKLGKLMRFLPFPVVAGFLAGSGWLLVSGAMFVLTGHGAGLAILETLARPEILVRVVAAIAFAAVLLTALRLSSHPGTTPVVMAVAVAAFYLTLAATGLDLDAARARRRLFDAVGHYNRPDVFRLTVDDRPKPHLVSLRADPPVSTPEDASGGEPIGGES